MSSRFCKRATTVATSCSTRFANSSNIECIRNPPPRPELIFRSQVRKETADGQDIACRRQRDESRHALPSPGTAWLHRRDGGGRRQGRGSGKVGQSRHHPHGYELAGG